MNSSPTGKLVGLWRVNLHDNPQTLENIMTTIQAQAFDVSKAITAFSTSIGSGVGMGKHFASIIDYVRAEDDTTVITRLVQSCERKADPKAASLVLTTFKKIFTGATVTTKNGKMVGLKLNKCVASNSALEALHTLVDDGVSMRGAKWVAAFKTQDDDDKKAFDLTAFVARARKAHPEISKAAFVAAFKA